MGNTLDVCEHLLNDLYPQIFSYLSPQDLVAVSLTSKRFLPYVTDEVWKELCRRDFGGQLEAHRQAARRDAPAAPATPPTPLTPRTPRAADGGGEGQVVGQTRKVAGDCEDGDEQEEPSSFFHKVLLTGLALRLRRGISGAAVDGKPSSAGIEAQEDREDDAMDAEQQQQKEEEQYYKKLYRKWVNQVLIVYHVYSNDEAEKDVENVLRLHGIEATSLVRTNGGVTDKATEIKRLKEQLADVLPNYRTVLYISNGGVSSHFQATIGDALADFVERGSAVIICPFATATERLMGRWDELECNPMISEAQTSVSSSLRRPPLCPDHPLFKNVRNVTASYRGTGGATPLAKALAYYEDGSIFAAELEARRSASALVGDGLVLAVNVFPPSCPKADQKGRDGGWEVKEGNDVPRVLSNAVRYAMSHVIAKKRGT